MSEDNSKMMVITDEDDDEVQALKEKLRDTELGEFNRIILNMCLNKNFRRYLIIKLKECLFKPSSDLKAGDPEGTGYNLGKSDAYKEILFDIRKAAAIATDEEKEVLAEILKEVFFVN